MSSPVRVLLVEDNPGDSDYIREILQGESGDAFDVRDVPRLSEATYATRSENYDVVLLDLGLPDSVGLDTLRTMRTEASDVPIVVVTGNTQAQVGLEAIQAGAQDFVVKGQMTGAYLAKVLSFARERHEISRRLQESEDQLHQSQKMEALGQLAGGIAHDFNNLLTAILGYSDLLLGTAEASDAFVQQGLGEIKHAAERAASLTQQILSFSRRQTMRTRVISLNQVLVGVEPLLLRTLGEDIDLVAMYDSQDILVDVDLHLFEQVLLNLALNARDAMRPGGRLTIETGHLDLDEVYCCDHHDVLPGRYAMLAVSDTGCGMDERTISHVFEPFFTTKPPGRGTGLGLATVYGIVKQSGGSISVYSEVGAGTCFKIYLPIAVNLPEEEPSAGSLDSTPTGHGETILVVEDEAAVRRLVFTILTDLGYRVQCAASAEEALEILDQESATVDLLLTDLVLPGGIQGHDLACRAIEGRPGMRILYMSGYTRNGVVHGGRLDRGISFLEKPFTLQRLANAVWTVLNHDQKKD